MDVMKMGEYMQYVERNGCCLNIEEKIKLGLAISELMSDLNLQRCYFVGKVTGRYQFRFVLTSFGAIFCNL